MTKATPEAAFWEHVAGMFSHPLEGFECPVCGSTEIVLQNRDPNPERLVGGEVPVEAYGGWLVCGACLEQWPEDAQDFMDAGVPRDEAEEMIREGIPEIPFDTIDIGPTSAREEEHDG